MDRYQVVPDDFHTGLGIHHFQMSVNFYFNLLSMPSSKFFSSKIVLSSMKITLRIFLPPKSNRKKFHNPAKDLPPWYPGLIMTAP